MKELRQHRVDTALIHSYKDLENADQYVVMESRSMVSRGRDGEGGRDNKWQERSFVGDGYVHSLECGHGFLGIYLCQNVLAVHFIRVKITLPSIPQSCFKKKGTSVLIHLSA